jgi:hypothetical protein
MPQVQRQSGSPGQIEALNKLQTGNFVEGLLRIRGECLPMRIGELYLSHSSPFAVGKGEVCQLLIPNNLRQ